MWLAPPAPDSPAVVVSSQRLPDHILSLPWLERIRVSGSPATRVRPIRRRRLSVALALQYLVVYRRRLPINAVEGEMLLVPLPTRRPHPSPQVRILQQQLQLLLKRRLVPAAHEEARHFVGD